MTGRVMSFLVLTPEAYEIKLRWELIKTETLKSEGACEQGEQTARNRQRKYLLLDSKGQAVQSSG